jgi:dTDP-4-amino-4,6-dideoxygalactose transaminase
LPEFVDIDERTYNLDPEKLREFLETKCDSDQQSGRPVSRRTGRVFSAVIPVHLYGQPADMDAIQELADAYRLIVVEDACQAHGAEYFSRRQQIWKKAGSIGQAAAFSFYPGKNLGACGEAGAVTTNDSVVAQKIRMLRDHGQVEKYYHDVEGYNGRLDALQAGILHAKLDHLARWNFQRRDHAAEYRRLFSAADSITLPFEPSWSKPVYHLYVVRTEDRVGLMNHLREAGIGVGIHYPIPLHLQKAYESLNYNPGDFPVAEQTATEIISLPMFPHLTTDQQNRVVQEILAFTSNAAREQVEVE